MGCLFFLLFAVNKLSVLVNSLYLFAVLVNRNDFLAVLVNHLSLRLCKQTRLHQEWCFSQLLSCPPKLM